MVFAAASRTRSALVVAVLLPACAPSRGSGGHKDGGGEGQGGEGGSGGGGKGGGGGSGGSPGSCTPGNPVCDGGKVRQCDPPGKPGAVLDTCAESCSFGRCTSAACAAAESKQSVIGCLFYAADTDNHDFDDKLVFGFPVGNPGTSPVNVKVERATGMGAWKDIVSAMVMPGEINYLRMATGPGMAPFLPAAGDDWHVEGTGQEYKGYRISSEGPIVAYDINSDDEASASANSGSTLLLPIHALGRHYYAMTPPDVGKTGNLDHAFVSILGAFDGTKVEFHASAGVGKGGAVPAIAAGSTYTTTINEGEILNLESDTVGQDLSGSEIVTDKPVAVYAGSVCGGFDPTRASEGDCDHIEEEMYPVSTWGKSFVFLDLRMPAHAPSKSIWGRIVASEDGTAVGFDAPRMLPGLPATTMMNRGDVLRIQVNDTLTSKNRAHFTVSADKPIEVESFMGAEEGGAVVIPVDQFLDDYLVSAHPWFTGYLMVTRPKGTPVALDGAPMSDSLFTDAGGGFEVSFVAMPRCETDLKRCGHRVVGAKIGATLTANGGVCNYCYAGGAGARCVNRTAGCK